MSSLSQEIQKVNQNILKMLKDNQIKKKLLSLFNRDTEYWNSYYDANPPTTQKESLFAAFVCKYLEKGRLILDLGCGNGRDSFFFHQKGLSVVGIDASSSVINVLKQYTTDNIYFICSNFINDDRIFSKPVDYFYSRFTLHAIDKKGENELLRNIFKTLNDGGMLFIEARSIHDEKFGKGEKVAKNAYLLDGHYRRFIDMSELLGELVKIGFYIKYAEEARGFAPYKDEDSEIIRIVASKIQN